jgi:membrane protease YdiL (CAAX protease family)
MTRAFSIAPDTLWRKVWISVAITAAFIAATILFVSVPASRFSDPAAREYAAAIARVILAMVAIIALRKSNWASDALRSPTPRSWWIILPVAIYSLIVYPLLFTGTLALNLGDPNLASGVACNGFAAGALEELVFRGLILSLWLSSDLEDNRLKTAWRAIIVSALFFSLPHALNLFAGHAEARVIAQLLWSFLLGAVFACLRIVGRSIWPVAVLHGVMNAFVHVNRLGVEIQPSLLGAVALACAPLPLCLYAAILLRKELQPRASQSMTT